MSEHASLDWPGYLTHGEEEIRRAAASICKRYGAPGEMDDMGQIVLVRLIEKKEGLNFENRGKLFFYIKRMVLNEILRVTRRGRVQPMDPALLAALAPAVGGSSEDTDIPPMDELLALIEDEQQREACRLHFVEGLKLEAVGKRLGVSTSTAFRLIDRAKAVLRAKLGASRGSPEDRK